MGWYKTGTVNVTNGSAAVTGVGTGWVAGAQPGHGLIGPDHATYEILSVNSDASITLAEPYFGSSASGAAYKIIPTQGLVQSLANAAQTLVATVTGYISGALAGLFSSGSSSIAGIGFVSDPDTGISRLAANVVAVVAGGAARMTFDGPGNITTLTTDLTVAKTTPITDIRTSASGQYNYTSLRVGPLQRWVYGFNPSAETGGNEGSEFFINYCADDGSFSGQPILLTRKGDIQLNGKTTFNNPAADWTGGLANTSLYAFDNAALSFAQSTYNASNYAGSACHLTRVDSSVTLFEDFRVGTAIVGSIRTSGTNVSLVSSSDRRLKTNIVPAPDAGGIIDALLVVSHDWIAGGHTRYGIIAQDVNAVYPEAAARGDDGADVVTPWGVDVSQFVPLLLQQTRALRARVAALEAAAEAG